ncbi:MAG: isoprenylcysteine carboxylmethyltransferase family protein [Alistipes sp.]|nr:isoprenylcysteine carboxylmethyltransferase family protein [Alistipes sp.]
MRRRLFVEASLKYATGLLGVGLMLFLPAGSLGFWQGWLLMGTLFVPMFIAGVVLVVKSPELLRKRLSAKERNATERGVVKLSGLLFVASFVVAGLNWRYGWLLLPDWAVWVAAAILLLSYLAYAEVMRENAYLSRIVEVAKGQCVVDTGLYGVVRHPMYTATTLLFLAMPIVLASPISFLVMLLYIPLIILRINDEEALLLRELEGYADYCQRVKYRLIPFVY